jgi:osmoprotectant transport system permease protein
VGAGAEGVVIPLADFAFSFGTFPRAVRFVGDNGHLMLTKIWEHLQLSGVALLVSLLIGLPLGIVLGHLHRGSFIAINVSNIGRALPSIALIGFGISLFGPTFSNVVIALVVLGAPPILANAYVGVDGVDPDVVEAGRGMGLSPWAVLWRLELPLALPLIFAGIRTAAVFIIATATLAAVSGTGGGLGDIIVDQASYRAEGVLAAALCVTALAFAADAVLAGLQWFLTPAALRGRTDARDVGIAVSEEAAV